MLATDMDGTFIPLEGSAQNQRDLRVLEQELKRHKIALMYVTGRHLELVLEVIQQEDLPRPPWLICDVGASIYQLDSSSRYVPLEAYVQQLQKLLDGWTRQELVDRLSPIGEIRLQETEKQTPFKISYYCDAPQLESLAMHVRQRLSELSAPFNLIASVDPFSGSGLIDLLPTGVSKAYALDWWVKHERMSPQSIVFAGDSGNDLAALTAGYRSIVVGNADPSVVAAAKRSHLDAGWIKRLATPTGHATTGVLEGLRHFLNQH